MQPVRVAVIVGEVVVEVAVGHASSSSIHRASAASMLHFQFGETGEAGGHFGARP